MENFKDQKYVDYGDYEMSTYCFVIKHGRKYRSQNARGQSILGVMKRHGLKLFYLGGIQQTCSLIGIRASHKAYTNIGKI